MAATRTNGTDSKKLAGSLTDEQRRMLARGEEPTRIIRNLEVDDYLTKGGMPGNFVPTRATMPHQDYVCDTVIVTNFGRVIFLGIESRGLAKLYGKGLVERYFPEGTSILYSNDALGRMNEEQNKLGAIQDRKIAGMMRGRWRMIVQIDDNAVFKGGRDLPLQYKIVTSDLLKKQLDASHKGIFGGVLGAMGDAVMSGNHFLTFRSGDKEDMDFLRREIDRKLPDKK